MLRQPLARLKIWTAFFTPFSDSASVPGLTSICAISVIIFTFPCNGRCDGGLGVERSARTVFYHRRGANSPQLCNQLLRSTDDSNAPKWASLPLCRRASVPIPKFARFVGMLSCELRNQRDPSKY